MKKNLIKCLSFMSIIAVIMTFSTSFAHAQTNEEKEINELAEALEFIFEKATVKNSSGEIVDIDVDMIEGKYGEDLDEDLDLDSLKSYLQQKNNSGKENDASPAMIMPPTDVDCMASEMKEFAKGFIPTTVISTVYAHLLDGEYLSAAKKLAKSGAKGSVVGIATQLTTT